MGQLRLMVMTIIYHFMTIFVTFGHLAGELPDGFKWIMQVRALVLKDAG